MLWDPVALHTSIGIASRKQPEVAITGLGRDHFPAEPVGAVHQRYPRHDIGYTLADLIVEQVHKQPEKAPPFTFPGHLTAVAVQALSFEP